MDELDFELLGGNVEPQNITPDRIQDILTKLDKQDQYMESVWNLAPGAHHSHYLQHTGPLFRLFDSPTYLEGMEKVRFLQEQREPWIRMVEDYFKMPYSEIQKMRTEAERTGYSPTEDQSPKAGSFIGKAGEMIGKGFRAAMDEPVDEIDAMAREYVIDPGLDIIDKALGVGKYSQRNQLDDERFQYDEQGNWVPKQMDFENNRR